MTELLILRPSVYCPMGTCLSCGKHTRVWLVEHLREITFCHACLGTEWSRPPDPWRIAELAQSYQRHEVMRFLDTWRRKHVAGDGTVTDLPP